MLQPFSVVIVERGPATVGTGDRGVRPGIGVLNAKGVTVALPLLMGPIVAATINVAVAGGVLVLVLVKVAVAVDVAAPAEWPARPARDKLSGETVSAAEGRIKLEMAPKSVRIITPASASTH